SKYGIKGGKPIQGWVKEEFLRQILAGGVIPSNLKVYETKELWEEEPRTGIKRNHETRTAEDQHLYTIRHIRPKKGLEIWVYVDGVDDNWHPAQPFVVPLGGEGRAAHVTVLNKEKSVKTIAQLEKMSYFD